MGYHRPLVGIVVSLMLLAAIYGAWLGLVRKRSALPEPAGQEATVVGRSPAASDFSLDAAGISNPMLVSAEQSGLLDSEIIIGVVAMGQPRAYLRSAFDSLPEKHIVNDMFGSVPVTIAHCDRTRCTRIFTSSKPGGSMNIRCGGLLASQQMVLLVDEQRFALTSEDIPLKDIPFVVTTWKEWLATHPETTVYIGY
jgi:hypothetical protein